MPLTSHPIDEAKPCEVPPWVLALVTFAVRDAAVDDRGTLYGFESWEPGRGEDLWEIDLYRIDGPGVWRLNRLIMHMGPDDSDRDDFNDVGWDIEIGGQTATISGTWEGHWFELRLWLFERPDMKPEGRMCLRPTRINPSPEDGPMPKMGPDFGDN